MTPIRVIFPFHGDHLGGTQISGILLAETVMALGVDVRFVLHQELDSLQSGSVAAFLKSRGHSYYIGDAPELVAEAWISRAALDRDISPLETPVATYLAQTKPDIVHTNCRDMHCSWSVLAKAAGYRHAWHARSQIGLLKIERSLVKSADLIIPASNFVAKTVPKSMRHRVPRLNTPIPPHQTTQARAADIRKTLTQGEDMHLVGLFSQLDNRFNNVELFCHAIRQVRDVDGIPVKYVIAGHGSDETMEKIENLCFDVRHRLETPGFVNPVGDWMAAMDVVVAPATREPLGRPPLKATSVGTPTLALARAGNGEAVVAGVNGILIARAHVDEFAYALRYIIQSGLKDRMHTMSDPLEKVFVARKPDVIAGKLLQAYTEMLGRRD